METIMLNTKAALAEQTRTLNAKAKQAAQADIKANKQVTVVRKTKQADEAQTVQQQSSTTTKPETVAKTSEKQAKTARPKPKYIQYLTQLLVEGKYSRKEMVEMTVKQCPETSKSSIETVLTDSQNPKYNRFPMPVEKTKDGKMQFKQ